MEEILYGQSHSISRSADNFQYDNWGCGDSESYSISQGYNKTDIKEENVYGKPVLYKKKVYSPFDELYDYYMETGRSWSTSDGSQTNNTKEEGDIRMSYVHAFIAYNRILLASDSRGSIMQNGQIIETNDTTQKVVYLKNMRIGIVAAGLNIVNGANIADWLTESDHKTANYGTTAEKLGLIAKSLIEEIPENNSISIAAGGFTNGKAELVFSDLKSNSKIEIKTCDYFWHNKANIWKLYEENGKIATNTRNIHSLIEFSDFLVQTEIDHAKFKPGIACIGGPIQTLLLEQDGPKWIHQL